MLYPQKNCTLNILWFKIISSENFQSTVDQIEQRSMHTSGSVQTQIKYQLSVVWKMLVSSACLFLLPIHMCGAVNNVLLTTYHCIRFVSHSQIAFLYWVEKKRHPPTFGDLLHGFWLAWKAQWLALSSWNHTTASWLLRWIWKAGYLL